MIRLKFSNNIYFASIEDPSFASQWQQKLGLLPESIRNHCLKFHQVSDQKKRFLGYWLLKQLLIDNDLNENHLSQISLGKFKKPFFANDSNLHFNLSYSGELSVCALSNNPIGIDIEKINVGINLENYQSVFTSEVWSKITSSQNPTLSFYHYWTKMEAVIKADGNGITGPIQNIKFEDSFISFNNIKREFVLLPIKDNYIAYAVGSNLNEVNLQNIKL